MRIAASIIIAFFAFFTGTHSATAEKRVALVIGNSAYENVVSLPNPVRDGAAITVMFQKAGFDVVESRHDLKNAEMRRALRDFTDKARNSDIAVIYYAGHGIEINGVNYLVPVDAMLERDTDAYDEAISLDRILQAIEPAKRLHLVILDACRNNPFLKKMTRTVATRSMERGLIGVEPSGQNTLIAYAAKAGFTAMDGDGGNSPFALALIKHLTTPGLDIRRSLGLVRDEVLAATDNKQEPYYTGSLGGEDMALVPVAISPTTAPSKADARGDYELAERVGTKDAWDSFISAYPSGFYTNLARAQRNKLAETTRLASPEKAITSAEEKAQLAAAKIAAAANAAEKARQSAKNKKNAEEGKSGLADRAKSGAEANDKAAPEQPTSEAAQLTEERQRPTQGIETNVPAPPMTLGEKSTDEKPREQMIAALPSLEQAAPDQTNLGSSIMQNIPRLLQSELKRVGCSVGEINGVWDSQSRKALGSFNRNAGTNFDVKIANLDALHAVSAKTGRVCPVECDRGFQAAGEHCEKITCHDGEVLTSNGICRARSEQQRAERATPHRSAFGGRKCFSFGETRVCQ